MATRPTRVCLIQDYLPPYRIPLFTRIAEADDIDFTLLLLARRDVRYAQWADLWRDLPFRCTLVEGWRFRLKSDTESGFNPALLFTLIRVRPDVVICSGFSLNSIFAILYRLFFRKRAIVWTEATPTSESYLSYPRLRTWMRRLLARCVDAFVDAGTEAREYAESLLPAGRRVPFFRSYNAIDNEAFAARCAAFRQDTAAFAAFKGRYAPRNILYSGQLIERKNIDRLLDAYTDIVRRSATPVGLILIGQGPLESAVLERKRREKLDHLYVEGFQLADDYHKYFAIADALVLLSVFDCNPLVVFESLAAGLPTICSKHAGNAADFIVDGRNGYIVDPDDTRTVADRIEKVLEADDRDAMAEAARVSVQKANYADAAQGFIDAVRAGGTARTAAPARPEAR